MENVLAETLSEWRRGRFLPGATDCVMSAFAYAARLRGGDPGATWRGTYSTMRQAGAILEAAGGMVALVGGALERQGFERMETPARGDIIVAKVDGAEVAGLWLGYGAAFRMLHGMVEIPFGSPRLVILAAWR